MDLENNMTEYTEQVDEQRLKIAAEEWGNKVTYIHYNNGIEETKYNNGQIIQKNIKTGHIDHFQPARVESLIDRFRRAESDMGNSEKN